VKRDRIAGPQVGRGRASLRRSSLVVGLAVTVVLAGLPGAASAAVTGLELVQATSDTDSASPKGVVASCPADKHVLGMGGEITNDFGQVVIGRLRPNPLLTSVNVLALEDETGFAGAWAVRAYAICAPPPRGLQLVSAARPFNSSDKSVIAQCPGVKRVLGAGGQIIGGGGEVVLDDIRLDPSLGEVNVVALEDGSGTTANWNLTAYAICAIPGPAIAGLERVLGGSATNSFFFKTATATCPAGKQVVGAAGDTNGGMGQVVMEYLAPNPGLERSVTVAGEEDENGFAGDWSLTAYAICAASWQRVSASSPTDSANKDVSARCPAGKQVTGAGGDITGGFGQVVLDRIVPFPNSTPLSGVFVQGAEDETGTTNNWSVGAYAICTRPPPGLQPVSATSALDSSDPKLAIAFCPAGKNLLGAAGAINGGGGQVVMNMIRAGRTPGDRRPMGVIVSGFEDENGFAGNWSLTADAICANPPRGLEQVIATSPFDSDEISRVTATCPVGKYLLGAGGEIYAGGSQVLLDDFRPNAALTSVTVTGIEDENGFADDWAVTAYANCASPVF
jgi:hypothetical protein